MRDTYVLILFIAFLAAGTFLSFMGKVAPELVIIPLLTGFMGLLTDKPKMNFTSATTTIKEQADPK